MVPPAPHFSSHSCTISSYDCFSPTNRIIATSRNRGALKTRQYCQPLTNYKVVDVSIEPREIRSTIVTCSYRIENTEGLKISGDWKAKNGTWSGISDKLRETDRAEIFLTRSQLADERS